MPYIRQNLGAEEAKTFTIPQLSDEIKALLATRQMLDPKRWGVSQGCFTTNNEEKQWNIKLNSDEEGSLLQSIRNSADKFKQPNLTEEDVKLLKGMATSAKKSCDSLLSQAEKTKESFEKTKSLVKEWANCKASWGPRKLVSSIYNAVVNASSDDNCTPLYKKFDDNRAVSISLHKQLGDERFRLFSKLDALMVFSQDQETAVELCAKKTAINRRYIETQNTIQEINNEINKEEAAAFAAADSLFEKLLKAMQLIMDAIKAVGELLSKAFASLVATASFFSKNPKALLYGGAAVAALTVLFILRPYMAATNKLLGA